MASLMNKSTGGGNKFPATERLKSQKIAEELFSKGSSYYLYPFRILYKLDPNKTDPSPKILVSVPKRIFKRAVDRNRIRRQIKEAYRLNKGMIFESTSPEKIPSALAIIYTSKEKLPFKLLEEKLILILKRLKN